MPWIASSISLIFLIYVGYIIMNSSIFKYLLVKSEIIFDELASQTEGKKGRIKLYSITGKCCSEITSWELELLTHGILEKLQVT